MGRYAPVIIVVMLMVYCIVEVAQADRFAVRHLPKWGWFAIIVLLPLLGSLGWLFVGRPRRGAPPPRQYRAPDDDPDFLRGL